MSSLETTVRPASGADLFTLVEFNIALARETEGVELDRARLALGIELALGDESRGRYFVAERDGEVVGSLLITREWSDWRAGWWWWVQSVYVVEGARRTGVYRALYGAIQAEAASASEVCGLRLHVEHDNAPARRTYESLGMGESSYRLYEDDFVIERAKSADGGE